MQKKFEGQVTIGDNSSSSQNEGRTQAAAAQRDEQLCRKSLHGRLRGVRLYTGGRH